MPPLACVSSEVLLLLFVLALPVLFACAVVIAGACLSLPLAMVRSHELFVRHASAWKRPVVEQGSPYRSGIRIVTVPRPVALRALDVAALTAGYAAPCVLPARLAAGTGLALAFAGVPIIVLASLALCRFGYALPARRVGRREHAVVWACALNLLGAVALATLGWPIDVGAAWSHAGLTGFSWVGSALVITGAALTVALWPLGVRPARRIDARTAQRARSSYKPLLWRCAVCLCSACAGLASSAL